MSGIFPSLEWLHTFENKLNSDEHYAQIAKNWEGDMYFVIEPEGNLKEQMVMYLDLWHGECRRVEIVDDIAKYNPAFSLKLYSVFDLPKNLQFRQTIRKLH